MSEIVALEAPCEHPRVRWVWSELRLIRAQVQLESHPYVLALRQGSLSRGDLQILATEYDHIAVGIAVASRRAAVCIGGQLAESLHALTHDAVEDVERWRRFSVATGWCHSSAWYYTEDPFPETVSCASALIESPRSTGGGLIGRLYTARILQGDFARAVAGALELRYGLAERGLAWFLRHESGDPFAAQLDSAVDRVAIEKDPFVVLNAARETARTLRRFYDSLDDHRIRTRTAPADWPSTSEVRA